MSFDEKLDRVTVRAEELRHLLSSGDLSSDDIVKLSTELSDLTPIVERIEELLKQARRRFHKLRLNNIYTRYADGHLGWASQAPFDGIVVTAAAREVPGELLEQLRVGGVLVAPVERAGMQRLLAIHRTEDGFEEKDLAGVIFVPMLSGLS